MKQSINSLASSLGMALMLVCGSSIASTVGSEGTEPMSESEVVYEDVRIFDSQTFYTDTFSIGSAGMFEAVLTDFNFPDPLESYGLSITTATESLGQLTDSGSFMFSADPGKYYLSVFATAENFGQYGIQISQMDDALAGITTGVSAVPVPAAVWLFGSGLLGLAGVTRRKTA